METYKVRKLETNKYQVLLVKIDNSGNMLTDGYGNPIIVNVEHEGILADCNAYIQLNDKDCMI